MNRHEVNGAVMKFRYEGRVIVSNMDKARRGCIEETDFWPARSWKRSQGKATERIVFQKTVTVMFS